MRLVLIPPYQNPVVKWAFILRDFAAKLKKNGQLEGVEVDVDEGYFVESPSERRDEEVLAVISLGIIKKVREYSETGKYDAIVLTGAIDPGFVPARLISKIPVTGSIHSGLHVASLVGERFSHIHSAVSSALIVRHLAERYGLSHKLASVRYCGHSTTEMFEIISKYRDNKKERSKDPAFKKIIDDIMAQFIAAIEKDRVDSLLIGCESFLEFEDELRQRLNKAGYQEIPIIFEIAAALQMARAMVNMKLLQTARAYPSQDLKAKPEYW